MGNWTENRKQFALLPVSFVTFVPIFRAPHQGPSRPIKGPPSRPTRPPSASAWSVTFRSGPDQYFSFSFFFRQQPVNMILTRLLLFCRKYYYEIVVPKYRMMAVYAKRDDKHIIYSPLCSGNLLTCCWKLPLNKYFNNCFK